MSELFAQRQSPRSAIGRKGTCRRCRATFTVEASAKDVVGLDLLAYLEEQKEATQSETASIPTSDTDEQRAIVWPSPVREEVPTNQSDERTSEKVADAQPSAPVEYEGLRPPRANDPGFLEGLENIVDILTGFTYLACALMVVGGVMWFVAALNRNSPPGYVGMAAALAFGGVIGALTARIQFGVVLVLVDIARSLRVL